MKHSNSVENVNAVDGGAYEGLTRRSFLKWSFYTAGSLVATQLMGCGGGSSNSANMDTLREPPTLRPVNGVLNMDLVAAYANEPIAMAFAKNGNVYPAATTTINAQLRQYAGTFPAPTLRVKPGDTIRIKLINKLPVSQSAPSALEILNYQNSTNLHFHGLHVDPGVKTVNGQAIYGDYVVDAPESGVKPGDERQHEILIPADHAPGIYWYHPHLHGSSAAQVSSGMFGAIIVENPTHPLFDPTLIKERVIFAHKHNFSQTGRTDSFAESALPEPTGFLLNGTYQPTIVMRPGEVQVWHFINSATAYPFNPLLDDHTMQAFARDGDPIPGGYRAINAESIEKFKNGHWQSNLQGWPSTVASPGSRISVVVKASDNPGDYLLRSAFSPWTVLAAIPNYEEIVARVRVEGSPLQALMPSTSRLAEYFSGLDQPITDAELAAGGGITRNLVLGIVPITDPKSLLKPIPSGEDWVLPPSEGGPLFSNSVFAVGDSTTSNVRSLSPFQSRITPVQTVNLNAVEEWTIATLDGYPHPFHIHVNDMYVTKVNGVKLDQPFWADTVVIPPIAGGGGNFTFRSRFKDFKGKFVWHCHVLEHEDLGMMQVVEVV